jgi:hypothetical protein
MAAKKATPPAKPDKAKKPAKDLKVRQLTEEELSKVAGGVRRMDQGDKSRQTVCR